MIFDLTLESLAGFVAIAFFLTLFLEDWCLVRAIFLVFLWQLLTPPRDFLFDIGMLFLVASATEYIYENSKRREP